MTHLLLMTEATKDLLIVLAIGGIAGLLASFIMPGRGFGLIVTILLGIAGGWLANKYLYKYLTFMDDGLLKEIVASTIGAMILILIINLFRSKRDRDY